VLKVENFASKHLQWMEFSSGFNGVENREIFGLNLNKIYGMCNVMLMHAHLTAVAEEKQ